MPRLSLPNRMRAVVLFEEGHSFREIGGMVGAHHKTVAELVRKYQRTGSVEDLHHNRRPKVSTDRQDRHLFQMSLRDRSLQYFQRQQDQEELSEEMSIKRPIDIDYVDELTDNKKQKIYEKFSKKRWLTFATIIKVH